MECMDALMDQDVRSFEVIFVDDASTDGSLQMVMDKYPDNGAYPKTRYISRKKNGGFCKAVNDGIRAADSEYILLLNNDTKVERDFVKQMYASIRRSDKIFSVSAKMLMMQDETLMDDSGDLYNALGWAYTKSKGKPEEKFNKRRKIFAACGGAAIYRKDILDKIGYFDDNHFAYLEDIDIGYRAKLNGYVNIYSFPLCKLLRCIKIPTTNCKYVFLSSSPLPCIIAICGEKSETEKFVYSINGKFLASQKEENSILSPNIMKDINSYDYLAYICNNNIFIRSIPSLAIQVLIEDLTGIYSIFTNIDKTILYGTNRIGSEIYVIKDESQN